MRGHYETEVEISQHYGNIRVPLSYYHSQWRSKEEGGGGGRDKAAALR